MKGANLTGSILGHCDMGNLHVQITVYTLTDSLVTDSEGSIPSIPITEQNSAVAALLEVSPPKFCIHCLPLLSELFVQTTVTSWISLPNSLGDLHKS